MILLREQRIFITLGNLLKDGFEFLFIEIPKKSDAHVVLTHYVVKNKKKDILNYNIIMILKKILLSYYFLKKSII